MMTGRPSSLPACQHEKITTGKHRALHVRRRERGRRSRRSKRSKQSRMSKSKQIKRSKRSKWNKR
eukprot:14141257-Alexandrium_andersonii.AAC.1